MLLFKKVSSRILERHEISVVMATEEEFFQVLDEMNKICGDQHNNISNNNNVVKKHRSRHCSANSAMSCLSYDSAIGDIYSVQTPKSSTDFDQELLQVHYESNPSPLCQQQQQPIDQLPVVPPTKIREKFSPAAQQKEVELVCIDLLRRFQSATNSHRQSIQGHNEDPLYTSIQLLTDSLSRMRLFLFSLEPMHWLPWPDRTTLYNAHVCALSILKASVDLDLNTAPAAYPLPYGEYLGEIEALHLILAHDLYNELRSLLAHIQELEIREFPVMLLVMMIAFFTPTTTVPGSSGRNTMHQPEKVAKVHDYYTHKLQTYLNLRHGPEGSPMIMSSIMTTIDKVRNFSERLREFLVDVTRCGLQKQYESVCENIGLMAFLLQYEPSISH